ncbi:putative F-box protein At3g17620 [Medicago truncatula]|uniref:putative F-box protein At3g17620 n=1 Tax=Medicago truncatula TaxID=3880 RepID=UPI000D2F32EF|nr:putative F-box protein At3g17620 [Medicago truncatula]
MSGFRRNNVHNRSPTGDFNQIPADDYNRSPANVSHSKPDLKHPYPPELLKNRNRDHVVGPPYALTHKLMDKVSALLEKQGKVLRDSGKHVQEIIQALLHNDKNHDKTATYLDCVNGILCIISKTVVVFWNPAPEKVKVIPPSQLEFSYGIMDHGFDYDHVRDDYKLIQYVDVVECHDPLWEIYSLKSDSWRKMDIDMPIRINFDNVCLNGICHWLGEANDNYDIVVVSFQLGNEVCFVTPLSFLEDMEYDIDDVNLQVLNEPVAVIVNHIETKSFHISILGEIGVGESWFRLFDIGPLSCIMRPIIVWNKGNIVVGKDDQLVCFDLTTGVIEEIDVKAEQFCHIFIYKKNLLPFGVIDN